MRKFQAALAILKIILLGMDQKALQFLETCLSYLQVVT